MAEVLLFDALGTLVQLEPPAPQLRRVLADRFGLDLTPREADGAMRAEIAHYRANLQRGRDPEALAELRTECAAVLRAALPPSERLSQISLAELTAALLAALRFRPFPDAAPALRGARARGQRTAVVSNWDAALPEVLERVGLLDLVDAVITSAAVDAPKPDPAPFRAALESLGADPTGAAHVGDSAAEDVAGARAAGVAPVLLVRRGPPPVGSEARVITSLLELASI
jgi:putative hydrolase of the HAD superfamily